MAVDPPTGETGPDALRILGPLEVLRSGRAVPLGGPRQRAVLALLLLEAGRAVSMDRLGEDVWDGHPPEGWANTLQTYVFHLRQALEPGRARGGAGGVLATSGRGYLLRAGRDRLDAAAFEDGFTAGRAALEAGRYAEAAQTLRTALGLWRGPVLADLAGYPFTRPEAARLEERRLAALEARIDADLALGRHDALTAELDRLAAEHPLRERLHGQLMLALYRCGRQAGALAAYRRARDVLAEELGIDPGEPPLRRLHASILAHDPVVAAAGLVAIGVVTIGHARQAVGHLAPTIGFLAALLLLADGCRRAGLFQALGGLMARGSRGSPRRLLALVFAVASSVTVALGLDPTIVLLTPVVLVTATRLHISPKPDVYATAHLANSASLLLPISNLTNLLVFTVTGLSFTRFAALMLLPTLAAIAVEWAVINRFFAAELARPPGSEATPAVPHLPRFAVTVLSATLVGFLAGAQLGVSPVWIAAAGAVAITVPALVRRTANVGDVVRAIQPSFLLFVLGLGVIVVAAGDNGLATAVRMVLPGGASLPDLLGIAAISALLANLFNNLPAILIIAPVAVASGPTAVLAALVGVNVGPNPTYVGSLATLLWRRLLRAEDADVHLGEFLRLGAMTVPAALAASTLLPWSGVKVGL